MTPQFIRHLQFIADHYVEDQTEEDKILVVKRYLASLGVEDAVCNSVAFTYKGNRIECPLKYITAILLSKDFIYFLFPNDKVLYQNKHTSECGSLNLSSHWTFIRIKLWGLCKRCLWWWSYLFKTSIEE